MGLFVVVVVVVVVIVVVVVVVVIVIVVVVVIIIVVIVIVIVDVLYVAPNVWFTKNIKDCKHKPVCVIKREYDGLLKYCGLYYVVCTWCILGPASFFLCKYLLVESFCYNPDAPNEKDLVYIYADIQMAGLMDE
jgi:hypothetical protein